MTGSVYQLFGWKYLSVIRKTCLAVTHERELSNSLLSKMSQRLVVHSDVLLLSGPRCEKTGLRGFRPGPTQTRLYSYRRWIEA